MELLLQLLIFGSPAHENMSADYTGRLHVGFVVSAKSLALVGIPRLTIKPTYNPYRARLSAIIE